MQNLCDKHWIPNEISSVLFSTHLHTLLRPFNSKIRGIKTITEASTNAQQHCSLYKHQLFIYMILILYCKNLQQYSKTQNATVEFLTMINWMHLHSRWWVCILACFIYSSLCIHLSFFFAFAFASLIHSSRIVFILTLFCCCSHFDSLSKFQHRADIWAFYGRVPHMYVSHTYMTLIRHIIEGIRMIIHMYMF